MFYSFLMVSFLLYNVDGVPRKFMQNKDSVYVFDWRQKGVISPVTDQGSLGSAVDFSIAEGVESLHAIETGKLELLSVQEISDCCDDFNQPKYKGFDCIVKIGGLCARGDYKPAGGACRNSSCSAVGRVTQTGYIPARREDLMVQAIQETPLVALLDASQTSFQMYTDGIYTDPKCSEAYLDHVVQVVGYGNTTAGQEYWIIKNSWGANWGENGYMRIAKGSNMCGIASAAFYPINKN